METKAMKPAWWNNVVDSAKSDWLVQNIKGFEEHVQHMLHLIEQNGEQAELVPHITEISERHHLLVDHFIKLSDDLNGYIPSEKTGYDPQQTPPFKTPLNKLGMLNEVGSDSSPSSGSGASDATPNESSEYSILSSDSDSESFNSSPKMEVVIEKKSECSQCETLQQKISSYAKEIEHFNEKLSFAEEEIAKLKNELQNNATVTINMGSLENLLAAAKNQIKLHEAEIEEENKRSLALHRQIVELEANLKSEKSHSMELQKIITMQSEDISNRVLEIQNLLSELQDVSATSAYDKWLLESSIAKLSESLEISETRSEDLEGKYYSLLDEIKKHEDDRIEMEKKHESLQINLQEEINHMKREISKKNDLVELLNKTKDDLKLKYDTLMAEKDTLYAELKSVNSERNDQINHYQRELCKLHSEIEQLCDEKTTACNKVAELESKMDELEGKMGMQAKEMNMVAEEKREAIRQLCFSLDHFRTRYEEVRDAYLSRLQPSSAISTSTALVR
ncbi:protein NETWORKED 4B-like [Andrographis paniculata]|uniref:protein NETWORKED 4B-like n=1 Tax=Andrographis paniculata TaxID=175694 RepID=UPI0021E7547D|nr:protein NETWORKED 4B-like [Andrographis paniculata]